MNENKTNLNEEVKNAATNDGILNEDEVILDDALPLYVERVKRRGTSGKVYNNYFVRGVRFGKEIQSELVPKDVGGWKVLEDMFDTTPDNRLHLDIGRSVREGADKKLIRYNTYSVKVTDEFGEDYIQTLQANGDTNKSTLDYIIRRMRAELEKQAMSANAQEAKADIIPDDKKAKKA